MRCSGHNVLAVRLRRCFPSSRRRRRRRSLARLSWSSTSSLLPAAASARRRRFGVAAVSKAGATETCGTTKLGCGGVDMAAVFRRAGCRRGGQLAAWLGRRRGRGYGSRYCSSWPSVIWRRRRRHASTCPARGRRRHVALLEREKQGWNGWWTALLQLACLFSRGRNQRGERATGLLACGRSRIKEGDGEVAHGAGIGALACCAWHGRGKRNCWFASHWRTRSRGRGAAAACA